MEGIVEDLMSLCGSAVSDPHATCNAVLPVRRFIFKFSIIIIYLLLVNVIIDVSHIDYKGIAKLDLDYLQNWNSVYQHL